MSIVVTFFVFMIGLFGGLGVSTHGGIQSKSRDTERKADINAIHGQLEVYYAQNGYYPEQSTFLANAHELFRGLDEEALTDPDGKRFNQGGDYRYEPSSCNQGQCLYYVLGSRMEDGPDYIKQSLN